MTAAEIEVELLAVWTRLHGVSLDLRHLHTELVGLLIQERRETECGGEVEQP
jgi:hypothetical protein